MRLASSRLARLERGGRLFRTLLLVCTIGSSVTAGPRIVGSQDPDGKEVREAAREFYRAIADGNVDAAHALFAGPQDHAALLDAELDAVDASRRVSRSIISHFGADNANLLNSSVVAMFLRMADRQSNATIVLNGDEAATASTGEPDNGLLLRKTGGQWKVVKASYGIRGPAAAGRYFTRLAAAFGEVRQKVNGGEIKTADAALTALANILAALGPEQPLQAAEPAPPPATQPAPTAQRLRSLMGRQLYSPEVQDLIDSLPCTPRLAEYDAAMFVSVPELGFDLRFKLPEGRVNAVHLYGGSDGTFSRYTGVLPAGLAFGRPRIDIERRLGRAVGYSGWIEPGVTAEYPNLKLLVQYAPGPVRNPRAPLVQVTLLESSSSPVATTRPLGEPPPQLAFRAVVDEHDAAPADRLPDPDDSTGIATLRIARQTIVDQNSITNVLAVPDENVAGAWKISMVLTPEGGRQLARATKDLIGRRIAIVLGSRILMAPVVRDPIADHVTIDFGSKGQKEFPDQLLRQISLAMLSLPAPQAAAAPK